MDKASRSVSECDAPLSNRRPSHFPRPTPKIPDEFLDNVRVFQGLACVKNPSTRRANQWPYPPDSVTLAPREQMKFLPDEEEEADIAVNQGVSTSEGPVVNDSEPNQLNFDGLSLTQSAQDTTVPSFAT